MASAARLCGLIALAALLVVAVAYRSLDLSYQHGRLSVPPLYDDVGYFRAAVTWLSAGKDQSLVCEVWALLHHHAPFSTLVAAIGLRLVPDSYIGPYLVHAGIVFAFMLGIIWLSWKRPALEVATCLIATACVPAFWHTITEVRPDLPSGLALGLAAGAVVRRDVLQRNSRSLVLLGAACALAVVIKPTAFPASLAFLGSAFVVRLAFDWLQLGAPRASFRQTMIALAWFCLGLAAVTSVLLGPSVVKTIAYILDTFVYRRDIWDPGQENLRDGLLRFSVGVEGQLGLHDWLWVGLALMIARLLLAAIRGRASVYDAIVVFAVLLIAYAIPSLAVLKTYFFGAIFYGTFIVMMTLNYCACEAGIEALLAGRVMRPGVRRSVHAAISAVPLAAASLFFIKTVLIDEVTIPTVLSSQQQESIRLATERLWSLLKDMETRSPGLGYVTFSSPYPVTPTAIELYVAQAGMNILVRKEYLHRTLEETEQGLLRSDILVISSSIQHNLVGPRVGDDLIRRLDANKDVCLLDSATFPDVTMRVYRRGC